MGEPSVRALILLGSRARSEDPADEWSDTDLLVFSTDADRWLRDGSWLDDLGPVILTFLEATALAGLFERRVLFEGAVDVDMVMIPIDAIEGIISSKGALPVLARGYRLLVDKDGRFTSLADRVAAADPGAIDDAAPWPPDPVAVANAMNDYLYHCAWITKKLRRGELAVAVGCQNLHQARTMRRFVEWQAKARTGGATNTYYDGRHLERWAVPETVAELDATQSRYSPSDVRRSVLESADLFRTIATEVGRACDVDYPDAAHERVMSWVREHLGDEA